MQFETAPRAVIGAVMAHARPNALYMPDEKRVRSFTRPQVFERWANDHAAVRPAALETGDNVITMFDAIGEDFWSGGGVTAKKVAAQLRAIGDRPVEIQLNSPGGDMFEGIAIYNILRGHPQEITIKIMGLAASAASIIAMAGDRIEIGAASFLMIHNCWVVAIGNSNDMIEIAKWLQPFDDAMASVYAARTGMDQSEIATMMDDETYIGGAQAIEMGFADALLDNAQIRADQSANASAQHRKALYVAECGMDALGMTRSQRRDAMKEISRMPGAAETEGTPGAAPVGTPSAAAIDWAGHAQNLLNCLKG
jgi:ATP-dependent Clp protease, protease subunit